VSASFHVEHFGCRAARADGEAVGDRLRSAGLSEQKLSAADVVIVNTCSVTAEADRAARAFIRRAHRLNPQARIVVTGCYAQRAPDELAEIDGVAAVIGNSHKGLAPEIILQVMGRETAPSELIQISPLPASPHLQESSHEPPASEQQAMAPPQVVVRVDELFAHSFLEEAQLTPGAQTRPNLKIQEGCSNRCSFCVIPQTRGASKSLPAAAVFRQVQGFVASGGNELVLSGINLGRWGRDLATSVESDNEPNASELRAMASPQVKEGPRRLAALVRTIFTETALPRLRLSSIEPMDWDGELIGLLAEFGNPASGHARLARHAHLPLQSGSDGVLRRMHRRYRPWHYAEKVAALLRAAGPDLTLGADVMVGFPGETDAEFDETVAFIRSLPFGYLHLFPFSPRPGTPGWAMHAEKPVRPAVVEERMGILRALAAEKSTAHRLSMVEKELEAITLHTPAETTALGRTTALTENFLPVELVGKLEANRLVRLRVSRVNDAGELEATIRN